MKKNVPLSERYRIIRPLTQGGMANLYLATSEQNPELIVVIKKVSESNSSNLDFVRMFKREAKISQLAKHPNLVQTLEAGFNKTDMYIVLEFIDGTTWSLLRKKMAEEEGSISLIFTLFILKEVSRGLSFLHSEVREFNSGAPIIHLDVSPQNVMISREGQVKLIDFGISKSPEGKELQIGGSVNGKLAYMSPEQARGEPLSPASDIFSMGLMLIEMATGKAVFQGQGKSEILQKLREWGPASFEESLGLLPSALASAAKAMLDPMPLNRPKASVLIQVFQSTLFLLDPTYNEDSFRTEINRWIEPSVGLIDRSPGTNRDRTASGLTLESLLDKVSEPKTRQRMIYTAALIILFSIGLTFTLVKTNARSKSGNSPTRVPTSKSAESSSGRH